MSLTADSNALLRLILDDDPVRPAAVREFLQLPEVKRGTVELRPTTVSEIVYVLSGSRQAYARADVARTLEAMLALPVRVLDEDVVRNAVELYRDVHPDWDDCVVAAYALLRDNGRILSYDRGLSRIPGIVRVEPPLVTAS